MTVGPEVICTLGAVATQALLGTHEGITRLRGNFQEYRSIKVMPTYHPAYLLRSPDKKREAWEDLKKIMAVMGLQRPQPQKP
jgi:DNA polymerase